MKFPRVMGALLGALLAFPAFAGLININTADADTLSGLPGIGPAKAAAIIQYRETNGPFANVEALTNVKGIGDKLVAALRDLVTTSE